MKLYEMDIKSALFLNGQIKEEVYVEQPPGFESNTFLHHVLNSIMYCMDLSKLLELGMNVFVNIF